jgi:hypothetical protein
MKSLNIKATGWNGFNVGCTFFPCHVPVKAALHIPFEIRCVGNFSNFALDFRLQLWPSFVPKVT